MYSTPWAEPEPVTCAEQSFGTLMPGSRPVGGLDPAKSEYGDDVPPSPDLYGDSGRPANLGKGQALEADVPLAPVDGPTAALVVNG